MTNNLANVVGVKRFPLSMEARQFIASAAQHYETTMQVVLQQCVEFAYYAYVEGDERFASHLQKAADEYRKKLKARMKKARDAQRRKHRRS